ncbi:MAG: hypothetical protein WAL32_05580 [Terriglobales bacterium]
MIRNLRQPSSKDSGVIGVYKVYNGAVRAAGTKRQPEPPPAEHHRTPQVYTLEATGLLVIAFLILVLTLARYWHHIPWSAR